MSMRSAIFNLTNTIIGSGALTMPYAFAQCGLVGANLIAGIMMLVTLYSAWLLLMASTNCRQGASGRGPKSFQELGKLSSGPKAAKFAMATFILGGLGTLTGYMIFIGRLLAQVIEDVFKIPHVPHFWPIVVVCMFILPLAWRQRIDALKYTSFLALLAIIYVACMFSTYVFAVGEYHDPPTHKYKDVELLKWSPHSVNTITLMLGAYCVHNTALPIYDEMENRRPAPALRAFLIAMTIAFCVYEALGVSAYFLLGGYIPGNCLLGLDAGFTASYPWTRVPSTIAKVTMAFLLSCSAPLALWPCRSAICSLLRGDEEPSERLFRTVTVITIFIVAVLASFIPDVTVPLGLVNSLAGGSMVFVMPGLFYLGSLEESARLSESHLGPRMMVFFGVVMCILGFALEVRSVAKK